MTTKEIQRYNPSEGSDFAEELVREAVVEATSQVVNRGMENAPMTTTATIGGAAIGGAFGGSRGAVVGALILGALGATIEKPFEFQTGQRETEIHSTPRKPQSTRLVSQ